MTSIAIVDSGPLLAAANRSDPDHADCLAVLRETKYRLVIPAMCVAEVSYFLGRRQGAELEARFLRGLEEFDVRARLRRSGPASLSLSVVMATFPSGAPTHR
jgi:predicted nucleic acid-binding protein